MTDKTKPSTDLHSPAIVVPFGVGKRTCPGKRFVEMELNLIVAKLIREFEVEFCDEINLQCEFLLAPKASVNILFKSRK